MRNIRATESFRLPFGMRVANSEMLLTAPYRRRQGPKQQPKTNTTQMQNYCKTIGALAAASALVAGNASAEVEYELHTGYTSEYLFRGLILGQDLVEAGADVSGEWNGVGLSAGAWYGSFDASSGGTLPGEIDFDELDLYGEASYDFGFLTAAVGYIFYHTEDSFDLVPDAQEVYFSIGRDWGFVNSSLTYFWDIETDNEGYSEIAFDRTFELNSCLALACATKVGYLFEQSDFNSWTTTVALDWAFRENATLSPFVSLAIALGDSAGTAWANTDNEFVAGTMLRASF
jgi:hypothetical protein